MSSQRPGPLGLHITRRNWLACTLGVGFSASGWLSHLAAQTANDPQRRRSCILLWMNGGPSQLDTFDPKPGHANGGPVEAIRTSVPGIRIGQHLPRVAQQMHHLAVIRSMKTREGDHGRATYHMRTGYRAQPPIEFPVLGSLVARERDLPDSVLPSYVSITGQLNAGALSPGFLGPRYAPLIVGQGGAPGPDNPDTALRVQNLAIPASVGQGRFSERLDLLHQLETEFVQMKRKGVRTLCLRVLTPFLFPPGTTQPSFQITWDTIPQVTP